jgi:hypothetical protein
VVGAEALAPEMRRTHLAFLKQASEKLLHGGELSRAPR